MPSLMTPDVAILLILFVIGASLFWRCAADLVRAVGTHSVRITVTWGR